MPAGNLTSESHWVVTDAHDSLDVRSTFQRRIRGEPFALVLWSWGRTIHVCAGYFDDPIHAVYPDGTKDPGIHDDHLCPGHSSNDMFVLWRTSDKGGRAARCAKGRQENQPSHKK